MIDPKACRCDELTLLPDFGHASHCPNYPDLPRRALDSRQKRRLVTMLIDLWIRHCPTLRFGQFIECVRSVDSKPAFPGDPDLFFIEDQALLEAATRFVKAKP